MKDTILIVDDEKILLLMKMILSKSYKTITAKNGQEGLQLYKENQDKIKMIVTDEQMPGMNGSEMVTIIREMSPNIPVVFVTASKKVAYEGGHMMLNKPFNIQDLASMVKTVMDTFSSGTHQKVEDKT